MRTHRPRIVFQSDVLPRGPWLYARQLGEPSDDVEPGGVVEVRDRADRFIGHGLYNPASDIRVRVISRGRKSELDHPREFLRRRIAAADRLRKKLLRLPEVTDAYRVVHAEGDDLSGLIVDRLGDVLVAEYHAFGFYRLRREVTQALEELYPGHRIVHRVPTAARRAERFEPEEETEELGELEVQEYGVRFRIQPGGGHKTGFFCDQRENRRKVASFCAGADVLDLCCNVGGFALHAAAAGARSVRGIDIDEVVLESARASARANGADVEFVHTDAFPFLREQLALRRRSRVLVLDPHKIVPGKRYLEEGLQKYGDLNALAIGCVAPGGLLATFSCSGAVDRTSFAGMVFRAARRAERQLRVLEAFEAGPDHPQRPDFPRSSYLKGLLLAVD